MSAANNLPKHPHAAVGGVFLHPHALVDAGAEIGSGTRVWAFAHVVAGARVGQDCNLCDHTFIEGGARLGDRVTVKCGVSLWEGVEAENDVFIGPSVAFVNDRHPRSQQRPPEYLRTRLQEGCSLGANATILGGLTIGRWAMVAAGAVVTRDVPNHALMVGSPAQQRGWVCRCGKPLKFEGAAAACACGLAYTEADHALWERA